MSKVVSTPAAVLLPGKSFVGPYLRRLWPSVAVATGLSAVLGVTGAAVSVLVGPCLQLLSAPAAELVRFDTLLGPRLGAWAAAYYGATGMAAGVLIRMIPWSLALLALVRAVMSIVQWFLWERAGELVSLQARNDLVGAYVHLRPDVRRLDAARRVEGELSSAITTDVRLMREYIVHYFGGLPREALTVVFLTVTLILLSPKLTLIFFVGILPAGAVASRVGKKLRKRAARALADYSDLSEWLQQRLMGIETIKHYRTEGIEIAKMHEQTESLYQRFLKAARVKARTSPLLQAFAVASMAVVLVVAFRDVRSGAASGAVQLSFFSALAMLSQSASKLGRYLNSNREGAAAVDRLRGALAYLAPETVPSVTLPVRAGTARLVIRNAQARYPGSAKAALAGVSADLEGGKIYCIAGPSGAGKSTLFNAILGLVELESGTLELRATKASDGATTVCYMPQKVLLAPDSVLANVAYPATDWDRQRVETALARVGLTEVIGALPQGVETRVGEGGHGLSGGQAQRILLARLWYQQAPIILVDEGTSALDPETERTVHALLRELARGGAVVVTIAHRQASAEIADELLLLADGRLVARGAPMELMASEAYRTLLR